MFFSNSKYYIKSTITSTQADGTTFLLSPDFELWANLETGSSSVSMVLKSGTQIERFEITATGGTATIVKRGLTQSGTETESSGLQKQWTDGTIAYVTALAFDILDKQGDTMSGALKFSGTTNQGLVVNSLTTAQRTALTPTNGAIVYDTDIGTLYQYIGGAWSAVSAGSTQPNASTSVAGRVEIATTAQSIAGTDTGETGALLSALPSDIASNTQSWTFVYTTSSDVTDTYTASLTPALTAYTTGQNVRIKFTTANTGACTLNLNSLGAKSIKLVDGTDPLDGDIAANGIYEFIYDGTNMVLQSVVPRYTYYWDGSDGSATITGGTTTLTRDMYYSSLTISSTGILQTAGFKVFCTGTINNQASGQIICNGVAGGNASGGTGGTATALTNVGSTGFAKQGIAWPNGTSSALASGSAPTYTDTAQYNSFVSAVGTSGGNWGNSGSGGGSGGSGVNPVTNNKWALSTFEFRKSKELTSIGFASILDYKFASANWGGSGGNFCSGSSSGWGGAGSNSAWAIVLIAPTIINAGTISANGVTGWTWGNGAATTNNNWTTGWWGGGGGSCGGIIFIDCKTYTWTGGTVSANGWNGGTGGLGADGAAGWAGGAVGWNGGQWGNWGAIIIPTWYAGTVTVTAWSGWNWGAVNGEAAAGSAGSAGSAGVISTY